MNRLRLAIRGFERLAPLLVATLSEAVSDDAEMWLREEVCPVVEELSGNRSFQLMTRWSLEHLCETTPTAERSLLQSFEDAFGQYATELLLGLEAIDPASSDLTASQPSAEDRATLQTFADRPWVQLVSALDFYHPHNDLYLKDSNDSFTSAFRSRELRTPLGDYVCRYLLARVQFWRNQIVPSARLIDNHLPNDARAFQARSRIASAQIRLDKAIDALDRACNSSNLRQREACAALVQVYAAYSPNPNLEWLGLPQGHNRAIVTPIRMCIRRRSNITIVRQLSGGAFQAVGTQQQSLCDPAVLRQITASLQDVATFYEAPEDPDDLIKWAADRARLVLVDRAPRQVFWDGTLVGGESWDVRAAAWSTLWTLALRSGRTIDMGNVGGANARSRRSRLSEVLSECQELDSRIETVRGQGYHLQLPSEDVILLQDDGFGQLKFVDLTRDPLL